MYGKVPMYCYKFSFWDNGVTIRHSTTHSLFFNELFYLGTTPGTSCTTNPGTECASLGASYVCGANNVCQQGRPTFNGLLLLPPAYAER